MIKRVLIFIVATVVVFFTIYFLHKIYVSSKEVVLPFSLQNIYLFQIIATVIVYLIAEFMMLKTPNQAGYFFLMLTMIQFGVFFFFFKEFVFSDSPLSKLGKFSFIIPIFLSLFIEVTAVVKMLNNKEFTN